MAQNVIVPTVKTLYLCDGHIGFGNQKTDLIGIFNSIRPLSYPHTYEHFVAFAQLLGGLGQVPFYFDIRYAADYSLVQTTSIHLLSFPNRSKLVQLAYTFRDYQFPQSGIYLVELYCDAQWVGDTTLKLH